MNLEYATLEGQAARTLTLFLLLLLRRTRRRLILSTTGLLCAIRSGLSLTAHLSAASIGRRSVI